MPKDKEIILLCPGCGYKNEPERVYCHGCGEKLDRSVLPKPEDKNDFEEPDETRKRVNKMMNPQRGNLKQDAKIFAKIIAFSAVLAAGILFWMSPDNVPPAKPDTMPDRDAGDLWTRVMEAKSPVSIVLTDLEINTYLSRKLKATESSIPGLKFERSFVHCEQDIITISIERSLWGFSLFGSVAFHPVVKDGTFSAEVIGIRFGRLGVLPSARFVGEFSLGSVFKAFEKEGKQLNRLSGVAVGEGTITFVTKPQL